MKIWMQMQNAEKLWLWLTISVNARQTRFYGLSVVRDQWQWIKMNSLDMAIRIFCVRTDNIPDHFYTVVWFARNIHVHIHKRALLIST